MPWDGEGIWYYDGEKFMKQTLHVRIKLNGPHRKKALFNYVMARLDVDWPWTPHSLKLSKNSIGASLCTKCRGWEWRAAMFGSSQLRYLVDQINSLPKGEWPGYLKLKVKHCELAKRCTEVVGVVEQPTHADDIQTILAASAGVL